MTTVASKVANHEERSCLELKKVYLEKACACRLRGMEFTADEAVQDQMLETYGAVKNLEKKARDKGIRNPIINKIVTEAAGVRDCYHVGAVEKLRQAEKALEQATK